MRVKEVIVSKFAKDDLREIIAYYQSLSQNYVEKTIAEFEKNILSLKDFPKVGRIVPELGRQGIDIFREIIQNGVNGYLTPLNIDTIVNKIPKDFVYRDNIDSIKNKWNNILQ